MKDSLIINNNLSNNFKIKAMKISNYLNNRLLIKNRNHKELIFKKLELTKDKTLNTYIFLIIFFSLIFL